MLWLRSVTISSLICVAIADYVYTSINAYPAASTSSLVYSRRPKNCRPVRPSAYSSIQMSMTTESEMASATPTATSTFTTTDTTTAITSDTTTSPTTTTDATITSTSTTTDTTTTSTTSTTTDTTTLTTITTTTTTITSTTSPTANPIPTNICAGGADFRETYVDTRGFVYGICSDTTFTGTISQTVSGEVQEGTTCANICSEFSDCVAVTTSGFGSCFLLRSLGSAVEEIANDAYVQLSRPVPPTPSPNPNPQGPCANGAAFATTFVDDEGVNEYGLCRRTYFPDGDLRPIPDDFVDPYECAFICSVTRGCIGVSYYNAVCFTKNVLNTALPYDGIDSIVFIGPTGQ